MAVAARLETDRIDRAVDLRLAQQSGDLFVQRGVLDRSAISKPCFLAWARRVGLTSPTITTAAPSRRAEAAAARPTGPAPAM